MSTFKTPVGPQPSKVYWRRRLVAVLALLAIIVGVVLIVVRLTAAPATTPVADKEPAAAAAPTTPTGTSTADAAADTGTVAECAKADLKVQAITDAASYEADAAPMLSLKITNTGAEPCTAEVGSDVQEYKITSGADLIWTSKDCQTKPEQRTQTLEPNKAVSSTPFAWDRTRSDPKTCDDEREKVTAAGASYHLDVIVDSVESSKSKQFLLN